MPIPRRLRHALRLTLASLALLAVLPRLACAQSTESVAPRIAEPGDASADFQVVPFLENLANPAGLTFGAGPSDEVGAMLYFSESSAGRVVRTLVNDSPAAYAVIEGFPTRPCPALGGAKVGPLGLAFLTRTKLAVGEGGAGPGEDLVRVYQLTGARAAQPYGKYDHAVGPIRGTRRPPQGGFVALAQLTDSALFAASLECGPVPDDQTAAPPPWLLKATVDANKAADLQRFADPRKAEASGPFVGATLGSDPDLPYVIAVSPGDAGEAVDSVLAWLSPHSGRVALALPCGLRNAVAVAAAPSPSGQLYVADASWSDRAAGGVYRIDAAMVGGRQSCRSVKIADVPCPVSLAFSPEGDLFVASWGAEEADARGKILKIIGEF